MFHNLRGVPPRKAVHPFGRAVSVRDRDKIVRDYLESLDSPRALGVWLVYRGGDHKALLDLSFDPLHYNDVNTAAAAYAATKFFAKTKDLSVNIKTDEVALKSALEAEVICQQSNLRIRALRSGLIPDSGEGSMFYEAARLIRKVLGCEPPQLFGLVELEPEGPYSRLRAFKDVGWSAGRSTSSWGDYLSSLHKYSARPDVSTRARRYAVQLLRDSPHWGSAALHADGPCSILSSGMNIVNENVMRVVPKNAKTGRTICYEPHYNIRLQLCVGDFIRNRLRSFGVDLDDQSINQGRAKIGSLLGTYATIDLKSASDTLSLELCRELLPPLWFDILNDLRSSSTRWPDNVVRTNEKFSSMGNGFTFELESLIFWALAKRHSDDVSVYGDDIIVPTDSYDLVVEDLQKSGFVINTTKSFSSGSFRESCGSDCFAGVDITPVYLRVLPSILEDVVKLHNRVLIQRWRGPKSRAFVDSMCEKWRAIHRATIGPRFDHKSDLLSDGHYHVSLPLDYPRASNGLDGWYFESVSRVYPDSTFGDSYARGRKIPASVYRAALCAALGPKKPRSLWDTNASRRRYRYIKQRGLASFTWPEIWG